MRSLNFVMMIAANAEKEFRAFEDMELQKDKTEIFDDCYIINFYNELYCYLTSDYFESVFFDDTFKRLANDGDCLIARLYEEYIESEASVTSWDSISDLIRGYVFHNSAFYRGAVESHA